MELWIRSQDKTALAQVDNLSCIENRIVFIPNNLGGRATVGKYKTQKRALEVLDEIQNILKPQKIIKTIDNTVKMEKAIHIVNPTYETITQFDTYVYEMPKE